MPIIYKGGGKTKGSCRQYVISRAKKIGLAYLVATIAYVIFDLGYFDITYFLRQLVLFKEGSNGHMYYLVFYFQLLLAAPFLVRIYGRFSRRFSVQAGLLIISIGMSYIFQNYTYFDLFPSGARFVFGGNYFFLFNFGIFFYTNIDIFKKWQTKIAVVLGSTLALAYMIDNNWKLVWWSNPPTVYTIIYSIVIFLLFFGCITLAETVLKEKAGKIFRRFISLVQIAGKNTLHIYLWHMMVVDILMYSGIYNIIKGNIGEKLLIYCVCLYLPCIGLQIFKKCKGAVGNLLSDNFY